MRKVLFFCLNERIIQLSVYAMFYYGPRKGSVWSETKTMESAPSTKGLCHSINSDFTPFHEPKNRSPNISLAEIIENQQKAGQKVVTIEKIETAREGIVCGGDGTGFCRCVKF